MKTPAQAERRLKEMRAQVKRRRELLLADPSRNAWDWEKERLEIERMKGGIRELAWLLAPGPGEGDDVPPAEPAPETATHDVVSPPASG